MMYHAIRQKYYGMLLNFDIPKIFESSNHTQGSIWLSRASRRELLDCQDGC